MDFSHKLSAGTFVATMVINKKSKTILDHLGKPSTKGTTTKTMSTDSTAAAKPR